MNARWMWSLALLATAAFGCSKLNMNRCDKTTDCANGLVCDTTSKTCIEGTGGTGGTGGKGGVGGAAGSHAGTGGKAFSCADITCSGGTSFCDMDAGGCRGCQSEGMNACKGRNDGGTPVCVTPDASFGAPIGTCVGCLTNNDCSDPKPVCVPASDGGSSPLKHTCVGCLANTDCKGTTPICNLTSNACIRCGQDSDCATVGPSICMTDGHCATDAETIYVQNNTATCTLPTGSDGGVSAGTKTQPFCSMQPVAMYLSQSRDLVVVDGTSGIVTAGNWSYADQVHSGTLSIVGQQKATIGSVSTPVFSMQTGTVYVRAIKFSPSASIGIKATGGVLTLNSVTVDSCMGGGIVLSGTTFDIERTTVTNNGPGPQGTIGGINVSTVAAGSKLNLVTIQNNKQIGIACDAKIDATGVYVPAGSNSGGDIAGNCMFLSCAATGTGCGAP